MGRSIGDQELALLKHVTDVGGATVGEAAEGFGTPRRLARSTVLTMMERLRQKGHLTRRLVHGVYRYSPRAPCLGHSTLSAAAWTFLSGCIRLLVL